MMRKVGIHDDNEITGAEIQAMYVGSPRVGSGEEGLIRLASIVVGAHPRPSLPARGLSTYT